MAVVLDPRPICVDASVAAARALPEAESDRADELWKQWLAVERVLVVPPHFGAELLSAVRRARVLGRVTPEEEAEGLELCLTSLIPDVQPHWPDQGTWRRAWSWALCLWRASLYDPLYLALAEHVSGEFWTVDGNLTRALEADGQPLPEWVHLLAP